MLREVEIRNSSPLLSKPHPPQNSEVHFFPLPVLPPPDISPLLSKPHPPQNSEVHFFPLPVLPPPDISVGGMLAHFVEQREELTDNKMDPLYHSKRVQDPIQVSSSSVDCSEKSDSISPPLLRDC